MSFWVKGNETVAIVTHVEDKGDYAQLRFTTSRLDKKSNKKVKSYFSFWNVRGSAMEGIDKLAERVANAPTFADSDKKMGVMIVIKSFSFQQESYVDKNGETVFSKQPFFTIWDWDFFDPKAKSGKGGKKNMDTAPEVEESEESRDDHAVFEAEDDEEDLFGED